MLSYTGQLVRGKFGQLPISTAFHWAGMLSQQKNGIPLVGIAKQNDPSAQAAYLKALDSLAEDGSPSSGFSFKIHTRFDEARARLSLIRAAYLAAFAALGWS